MRSSRFLWSLLLPLIITCLFLGAGTGCRQASSPKEKEGFWTVGEFSVRTRPDGLREIRDGFGRVLLLVPRDLPAPEGSDPAKVVRVPAKRVVAFSGYNVSLLKALGVLDQVLVGVTHEKEKWTLEEVRRGMDTGKIQYVGNAGAIDFERLKALKPDLVLTWDAATVATLEELGIPAVITTTTESMDLETRLRFVEFLAVFFRRQKEAEAYVRRVHDTVEAIRAMNLGRKSGSRPKVIWGDIYEKRVLVEPGNSWAAEMVRLAGGEYLFDDVRGSS